MSDERALISSTQTVATDLPRPYAWLWGPPDATADSGGPRTHRRDGGGHDTMGRHDCAGCLLSIALAYFA